MKHKRKKSYNPFKMWGSYAGAILIVGFLFFLKYSTQTVSNFFISLLNTNIQALTEVMTIGFLLGWGIQSLFRKLRK